MTRVEMELNVAEAAAKTPVAAAPGWGARLWQVLSSFPALLAGLIFASVFWISRDRIGDPDLWFHMRNAQVLWTSLHFPNLDTYSFTAAGSPFLSYEWLSETFYYRAFSAWGLQGVFAICSIALGIMAMTVFALSMREAKDPCVAAIVTVFGGLLAMVGFGPRTQDFGWLCFIAIYAILLRFRSAKRAPLWAIPVIFAVWINCHGTWPFGLIIFGIFIAAGLVRRDFGQLEADPWSPSELKRLVLTGAASVAALLANPFGYRMLLYPFDMAFHQSLGVANVEEWASVNFNDLRGKVVGVLLVGIFLMIVNGRKRWRVDDALLTLFVLYSGLSHIRFLLLAGLVLPPLLASKIGRLSSYDPKTERRFLNAALLAAVVGICLLAFPSKPMLESEIAEEFPAGAVQFLRDHPQQGHIFNLYQWGGYLEWNLPQIPTFIDSRNDIFEYKGVLKDYLDVASVNQSQEILDRYQVNYVLYPAVPTFPYFLSKSPRWERIYGDSQAVIYRRVTNP